MDKRQILFAFRLADATRETPPDRDAPHDGHAHDPRWKARDGIAAAGCTDYRFPGNLRAWSQVLGNDRGLYC
ncbi:MAG: hypothetical protein KF800_05535 [Lysobacter sp.]|nr:hypothetical protein [Lysobacter sp.]